MNTHENRLWRLFILRKQLLNMNRMNRTCANKNAATAGLPRQSSCLNLFCLSLDEVIA